MSFGAPVDPELARMTPPRRSGAAAAAAARGGGFGDESSASTLSTICAAPALAAMSRSRSSG